LLLPTQKQGFRLMTTPHLSPEELKALVRTVPDQRGDIAKLNAGVREIGHGAHQRFQFFRREMRRRHQAKSLFLCR
jgi:hypothetical protein